MNGAGPTQPEGTGSGRLSLELAAASCVVLVQELALIRWLPAQVRVLAYFPNLVLLGAFLGLGLGCQRAGRRSLLLAWPVLLLAVVAAAAAMSRVAFTAESASEHLFLLYYDLPPGSPVVNGVALPITACFVLCALSFVPLGQFVASRLDAFRERGSALRGYAWDIAGSLLGVIAFSAVSFAGAFPVVWFAVFLALGLVFVGRTEVAASRIRGGVRSGPGGRGPYRAGPASTVPTTRSTSATTPGALASRC